MKFTGRVADLTGEQNLMTVQFTMRQLLEAGVHFGHNTRRWNPKMQPYIWGSRNGIHIINLEQTVPYFREALDAVSSVVAGGGRVLFVGTKRQAAEKIAESAQRCGQYYINHRWPGGMLTNWKTISNSIKRMREIETLFETGEVNALTKKEQLSMQRQLDKMRMTFDGIRDMGGLPDILVVIDSNKEHLAIAEANVLKIPVVAVLDSNSNPDGIAYPIPGNDDALRAIALYCEYLTNAVLDGIQVEMAASGGDMGAAEDLPDAVSDLPPAEEASDSEAALPDAPVDAPVDAPLQSGDEAEEADKVAEEATEAQAEATPPEAKTGPATTAKKPAPKKPTAKKPAAKAAPASASDAKPAAKKASTRKTTETADDADAGADDKPAAKPKRGAAKTGSSTSRKAAASKPSAADAEADGTA